MIASHDQRGDAAVAVPDVQLAARCVRARAAHRRPRRAVSRCRVARIVKGAVRQLHRVARVLLMSLDERVELHVA